MRVIKTIGGREYYYEQHSYRENGKVKTVSKYIGPVTPRRKRRDGLGFIGFGFLSLGVAAVNGGLKTYKAKDRVSARKGSHLQDAWKPDTLAEIQLKARGAKNASIQRATSGAPSHGKDSLKEWRTFSARLHGQAKSAPVHPAPVSQPASSPAASPSETEVASVSPPSDETSEP